MRTDALSLECASAGLVATRAIAQTSQTSVGGSHFSGFDDRFAYEHGAEFAREALPISFRHLLQAEEESQA